MTTLLVNVTFADVWSIPAYDQFITHILKSFLFV